MTETDAFWDAVADGPTDGPPMQMADFRRWAAIASTRIGSANATAETLETALRTIRSAIPGYLKQKMTAEDFALIVIGAADSSIVNKALEKGR